MLIDSLDRPVGNGVTNPYYAKLKDDTYVVVKLFNNEQGNKSLLNDLYCNKLANILELPIPFFGVCHLNEETYISNNEIDENQYGPAFYSKVIEKSTIVSDYTLLKKISNKDDIEKILLFDYLVYNGDRNPGNLLINFSKNNLKLYAIDYTHAFDIGTIWDKYSMFNKINDPLDSCSVFERNQDVYSKITQSKNIDERKLLLLAQDFKSRINREMLSEISNSIPKEWIDDMEDMVYLEKYIMNRISNLDILAEKLINDINGR